ncbi:Carbonyl reductase [NADPH] 1 [Gracilariopsis chorda]|uniref:Carbonyl reductase [NADPH] 1 n=1 Tax=Gracilariopsis chorda TaxID=448386 RepID=A0A2V3J7Q6_9FLOR|nr:Carbonyl reductase [NADPH] 1 [Gracilariopsis chorda]|eukprot:PXF49280.1 Carbonyl reductase [NADPH] 1 [Gracilariopsis chorda]
MQTGKASQPLIAIVTGASRGLGQALASILLGCDFIVVCAQRTPSKLAHRHVNARDAYLDLGDLQIIEQFSQRMRDELPYVDVLINNAAICPEDSGMQDGPPPWREVLNVNFFSQVEVTEGLMPLLESSPRHPRVINISSGDGELVFFSPEVQDLLRKVPKRRSVSHLRSVVSELLSESLERDQLSDQEHVYHVQPAYRLSKAALNAYTRTAAKRARICNSNVCFLSVCPGDIDTEMGDPHAVQVAPEEAAREMGYLLKVAQVCDTDKFLRHGQHLAW